jgi:hypothetical protein
MITKINSGQARDNSVKAKRRADWPRETRDSTTAGSFKGADLYKKKIRRRSKRLNKPGNFLGIGLVYLC